MLLPSLCSCLQTELRQAGLALPPMSDVEVVERACEVIGMQQPGSAADRARQSVPGRLGCCIGGRGGRLCTPMRTPLLSTE